MKGKKKFRLYVFKLFLYYKYYQETSGKYCTYFIPLIIALSSYPERPLSTVG